MFANRTHLASLPCGLLQDLEVIDDDKKIQVEQGGAITSSPPRRVFNTWLSKRGHAHNIGLRQISNPKLA